MTRNPSPTLLIVEDDLGLQTQLRWCLDGYELAFASTRAEAIAELRRFEPAVVLQDLGLPPDAEGVSEGLATVNEILTLSPHTRVIVLTGQAARENALRAVAMGAYDYFQKPLDPELLKFVIDRAFRLHALEKENRQLRMRQDVAPLGGIIANSDSMRRICRMIEKVAPTSATVLLLGESGTGKELLAKAIHSLSSRADKPLVAINCAAIPEQLLESELFGHEKGSFSGAVKQTLGKIECAAGGTLFLDEIGDMPVALQAKMLRFLQERFIERVGGRQPISVDVRIVCATNRDLIAATADGTFRQDLYYRVAEVSINVPPLRDRESDSVVIAQHLLQTSAARHSSNVRGFTPDATAAIQSYHWPGNVRELENKVNTAVLMAENQRVTATDLGLNPSQTSMEFLNLRIARQRAEDQAVRQALALTSGNLSRAAELLGVSRPTLYDLLARINPSEKEKEDKR